MSVFPVNVNRSFNLFICRYVEHFEGLIYIHYCASIFIQTVFNRSFNVLWNYWSGVKRYFFVCWLVLFVIISIALVPDQVVLILHLFLEFGLALCSICFFVFMFPFNVENKAQLCDLSLWKVGLYYYKYFQQWREWWCSTRNS